MFSLTLKGNCVIIINVEFRNGVDFMSKIKPCYIEEIKRVADITKNTEGEFKFAVVADTHLDNSQPDTICNMQSVDKEVDFKCLIHLGDFLNGNFPRKYTKKILKEQMDLFVEAVKTNRFYPTPGNHDGFVDRVFHNANDMTINEDWYEALSYMDNYDNVKKVENRQYFYADYPDEKVRFISVNSFHYTGFSNGEKFKKVYGYDKEQIEWIEKEALNIGSDWTVIFFSHDMPFSGVDSDEIMEDNGIVNGNLVIEAVERAKEKNGFSIAAWFIGHHHGDLIKKARGINYILVGSETAYRPQLWSTTGTIKFYDRFLNTDSEDLWDSVILNKKERKLTLVRFGVGDDRVATY